jgi:hypothetical protein
MRQDRNRTRYARKKPLDREQSLEDPRDWKDREFLEDCWKKRSTAVVTPPDGPSIEPDPFETSYERINSDSLSGADTAAALQLIWEETGDEAFRTALLALRAYRLNRGGLKETLKRHMRGTSDVRPAVWMLMPMMDAWRRRGAKVSQAACLTAAQYGLSPASRRPDKEGASEEEVEEDLRKAYTAVVEDLRKAYPRWLKSVASNAPADPPLSGDTGRKLKVLMTIPSIGTDGRPETEIRGVIFGEDGTALAPDDAHWRSMVHEGRFHLCGVVEKPLIGG